MPFFLAPTESRDEPRRLRTVWRFLIFGAGFMAVQFIVAIGVGLVWLVWLAATGQLENLNPVQFQQQVYDSLPELSAISAVPVAGLMLGVCALCRVYLDRRPFSSMGLVRPARGLTSGIVPGFLIGTAPIVIAAGGLWAVGGYRFDGVTLPRQALYMAPAFVFLAFNEEITFRGYLLQNLVDIRRSVFGVLFTSLVFWLMHSMNPGAWSTPLVGVNLFGAGVLLSLAYLVSGNIWFPTALHFGWNFAQGVLFSIPVSGMALEGIVKLRRNAAFPTVLTGGEFGLEASAVTTVLELIMIGLFVQVLRSRSSQGVEPEGESEIIVEPRVESGSSGQEEEPDHLPDEPATNS